MQAVGWFQADFKMGRNETWEICDWFWGRVFFCTVIYNVVYSGGLLCVCVYVCVYVCMNVLCCLKLCRQWCGGDCSDGTSSF